MSHPYPSPGCLVLTAAAMERLMSLSAEGTQFFELSRDLLCVLDCDGYLREHSRSWEALTGRSQNDLRNVPFLDFLHPDDRKKAVTDLASLKGLIVDECEGV